MPTQGSTLPPLAKQIKAVLRKTPQGPTEIAKRLGREHARGTGRAFTTLVREGIAVRDSDGRYRRSA